MSARDESVTIKTTLPPSASVNLGEKTSPVAEAGITEILQGEGDPDAARKEAYKRMTPEERAQRRAHIVTALERGVVNDRMMIPDAPKEIHYEWVRRDPTEVEAMVGLGFKVEKELGKNRGLNTDGTGAVIVHDVILMSTSRENKELIDEVKQERAYAQANPKGPQREEKEFAALTRRGTDGDIPTMFESKATQVRRDEIAAALDAQTKPQIPG